MDNTEEKFDKLWEVNEKLAREINVFEEEYAFVMEQSQLYAMQNLAKDVDDVIASGAEQELPDGVLDMTRKFSDTLKEGFVEERTILRDQATQMNDKLQSCYTEQESVITEILELHREAKETFSTALDSKDINFEIFPEYLEVVKKLKDSHNDSTQQLMAMLDTETA